MINPGDAKRLFQHLDGQRSNFTSVWQEIVDLFLPDDSNTSRQAQMGERRGRNRYDSTGDDATEKLANAISSTLTNPAQQWFTIHFQDDRLDQIDEVREWLEEAEEVMYPAFAASNFYPMVQRAYLGLAGFGTVAMFTTEKPPTRNGAFGGYRFETWANRRYVFTEGDEGTAEKILRVIELPAEAMAERMERLAGFSGLGEAIDQIANAEDPTKRQEKVKVLHTLDPQPDGRIVSTYDSWQDEHRIAEHFFHEPPVSVARWKLNVDDGPYGRSPAMKALPTMHTLNEASRLELRAWSKDIDPPLRATHRGVVGSIDLGAGEITYVRRGAELEPIVSGGRFDIAKFKREETREQIFSMFLVENLRLILGDRPQNMTATEFVRRVAMVERELGPAFGRVQNELLTPILIRAFNILVRTRAISDPPDIVLQAARAGVDLSLEVEYQGPLARAQRAEGVGVILDSVERIAAIVQATGDPTPLDRIDLDLVAKEILELSGTPASVIRGDDDVAAIRQQRAEAEAQQAQLQQSVEATQLLGNASQTLA